MDIGGGLDSQKCRETEENNGKNNNNNKTVNEREPCFYFTLAYSIDFGGSTLSCRGGWVGATHTFTLPSIIIFYD